MVLPQPCDALAGWPKGVGGTLLRVPELVFESGSGPRTNMKVGPMRLLFGMVLGFVMAVAVAYWHDSQAGALDSTSTSERIVNWDVADRAFRNARMGVGNSWDRLTGRNDFVSDSRRERL